STRRSAAGGRRHRRRPGGGGRRARRRRAARARWTRDRVARAAAGAAVLDRRRSQGTAQAAARRQGHRSDGDHRRASRALMRVLLVGSPPARARLRAQLNGSLEIAGEFATVAAARAADTGVEAMLVADDGTSAAAPDDEAAFDEPLTAREVQVLELLAEGLPN